MLESRARRRPFAACCCLLVLGAGCCQLPGPFAAVAIAGYAAAVAGIAGVLACDRGRSPQLRGKIVIPNPLVGW